MTLAPAETFKFSPSTRHSQPRLGARQLVRSAMETILPRSLFLVKGPRSSGSVCLTFDDGPHPQHTPPLLDVLDSLGVPGTFFLIGKNVEQHPDLVRRMVASGHVVGHHTFHHSRPQELCATELMAEIRRTDLLFREILGQTAPLFRPPWGKLTASKFCRLWGAGKSIVLWNADPKDCECQTVGEVRERLAADPLEAGDILLMHDDQPYATEVLPELVADARNRGLSFATPLQWTGNGSPRLVH
jgi:peptidoglycan/xylan/chitin deacetylase (PgdA/CDA1 family)